MTRGLRSRMAGVGTAVGAVILGGIFAGCQPGTICDKDEYQEACEEAEGNPVTSRGGSSGNNGGSGGSNNGGSASGGSGGGNASGGSGGMASSNNGGAGGGGSNPQVTCAMFNNNKDEIAEKLVVPKCGKPGGACHGVFPPKFTTAAEAVMAMVDKPGQLLCRNDNYINKADVSKSFILAKVKVAAGQKAACPTGGAAGGDKMPYMPDPALSDAEVACLEFWAREVAK